MDEHLSEDDLATFASNPAALPQSRLRHLVSHTSGCEACSSTLQLYVTIEDDLGDADVYEPAPGSGRPGSPTYEFLMSFASRIRDEDERAKELLKPYFENPALAYMILTRRESFTAGVVRQLAEHAHAICESAPLDALTFAEIAAAIADTLSVDSYDENALYELRGTACLVQAMALMLLGGCPAALDALVRAERAFKKLRAPGFDLASVALVRAGVLYQQQRLNEAHAEAERAEHGFAHSGDDERRMKAVCLRAAICFEAHRVENAKTVLRQVIEYGEQKDDPRWVAVGSSRMGNCEVALGHLGEASIQFHRALSIFREIGPANERVGAEWGIAQMFLRSGRHRDAIVRLQDVKAQFETLGMLTDAALVGLDIAEGFLSLGRMRQISAMAKRLLHVFTEAGMLTGALTALAYIRESADTGTLSLNDLAAVRGFLRRAEREPTLAFVPPPSQPR